MCERTVQTRLGSGMTPEEIVTKPIRQTKRKFVPCDPSIENCLNCQKEDCNCDLPPRPGETNTGDVLKNVISGGYESPETVYHCVLDLGTIEEKLRRRITNEND